MVDDQVYAAPSRTLRYSSKRYSSLNFYYRVMMLTKLYYHFEFSAMFLDVLISMN
ncbi:hypothetical protein K450DRAFT_228576 [Umbelopsis ramanniana AG]|uniref:Uncharacterized protein n=1 Tax=Umbelopsis ramanniana AG TaxID=1314678 RepID=A0AAD5HGP7_UMBRA|nr:uncharacterized protein K450DRAFT_228576 [Umbelopsis ramanniana AG]KAI8582359.1 hypothetical protein K450DRAFT_228576 [Umbelopsis ramanniana AG]